MDTVPNAPAPPTELGRWLCRANAGELGAALAYRGHARTLRGPERQRVLAIMHEELLHRREVTAALRLIGQPPCAVLDRRLARLGRVAGFTCTFTGIAMPMLGACLAELINVGEYRQLGAAAQQAGVAEALALAQQAREREAEHARWFAAAAARRGGWAAWAASLLLRLWSLPVNQA